MKQNKLLLIILLMLTCCATFAQKTEFSATLGSGLFSYAGKSAEGSSFINLSNLPNTSSYTNNPYGTGSAFSYTISGQVQRITKRNNLLGLQIGYESLSSKTNIDCVYGVTATNSIYTPYQVITKGRTVLTNQYINLQPYFGHRVVINNLSCIDLTGGVDFGIGLSAHENGEAKSLDNSEIFTANLKRYNPGLDLRLRLGITSYYRKAGVSLGYSYGRSNYSEKMVGGNFENYSRFIRLGLSYRIND